MSEFTDPRKLPIAHRFDEAVDDLLHHAKDSSWSDERCRVERIARIAESVSTVGTPEQQRAFAEQVIDGLRLAYEMGKQAQDSFAIAERLYRELWAALYAIGLLETRLIIDRAAADALGLTDKLMPLCIPMLEGITEGIRAAVKMAEESEQPHRGRKKRLAVEVADMIAQAYQRHLQKDPARSRRGSTGKALPFQRACNVVKQILSEEGRPISLGHTARLEGIKRNDIDAMLAAEDRRLSLERNGNDPGPPPPTK